MEVPTQNDGTGVYIQPSRRPDGSLRKAIRVKAGYVPQDEVPLYESKGKQFASRRSAQTVPVGMDPSYAKPQPDPRNPIPGLVILDVDDKKKKKKKKTTENSSPATNALTPSSANSKSKSQKGSASNSGKKPVAPNSDNLSPEEIKKRIKNLKKKVREINTLEQKIEKGEIKNPEKDQTEKLLRKPDLLSEIMALKLSLYGDSPGDQGPEEQ